MFKMRVLLFAFILPVVIVSDTAFAAQEISDGTYMEYVPLQQTLTTSDYDESELIPIDLTVSQVEYIPPPPPPPEPKPVPAKQTYSPPPNAGTPDPGSAKAEALAQVQARGWGIDQYDCLVSLWQKESGWNHSAMNSSSGAYGIPQALPGSKMISAGSDWETNPTTQIRWGLSYIEGRYGTPCAAWQTSQAQGWY